MAELASGEGLADRLHDFLLRMAGRVDDDALTSARELVAIAELDRAAELLIGCLIAGGVPVNPEEHKYLRGLLEETRSEPALADRLKVRDTWYTQPHRFSSEPDPAAGVAEALRPVTGFLLGLRSVQCVWRITPAGATPGAVPQRVVVVEIGPEGYAPATAYRIGQALDSAGLRAVVEVLRPGVEASDYHVTAATVANPVNLDGPLSTSADTATSRSAHQSAPAGTTPAVARSAPIDLVPEPEPLAPVEHALELAEPEPEPEPPVAETVVLERPADPTRPPVIDPPAGPAALGLIDYQPVAEDKLSDVERDLLRQLHEELAQREQKPKQGGDWSNDIPQARSGPGGN
ncbi:hypothetical protein GCM10010174_24200 [Kutzneria viridogrisea]|uniref:Uncharacterized protein n=2 Tax=Kutzneria TaxID=43356 RepID=W5VXT9_9PSEU|nr:hypothetical protein [Kutzneria albida]AHH93673.1 hypothetical protein KALB_296 [Kutzneria albida DSM 43870]MBA8931323.1 hypothetical protein [Kutzneria viridogrisea]